MDDLWFFPLFLCVFQIKTLSHYLEVKKKVRCPKLLYILDLVGQECYFRKEKKNGVYCLNAVPIHKIHRLSRGSLCELPFFLAAC